MNFNEFIDLKTKEILGADKNYQKKLEVINELENLSYEIFGDTKIESEPSREDTQEQRDFIEEYMSKRISLIDKKYRSLFKAKYDKEIAKLAKTYEENKEIVEKHNKFLEKIEELGGYERVEKYIQDIETAETNAVKKVVDDNKQQLVNHDLTNVNLEESSRFVNIACDYIKEIKAGENDLDDDIEIG